MRRNLGSERPCVVEDLSFLISLDKQKRKLQYTRSGHKKQKRGNEAQSVGFIMDPSASSF